MTLNHICRRLHLYLALSLLPWFLVYGVSSLAIQHSSLFVADGEALELPWEPLWERPLDLVIPDEPDWRQVGATILQDAGDEGLFYVNTRNPLRPVVTRFSFWSQARYTFDVEAGMLAAEARGMNLRSFIVGLHFRGGFAQESFFNDLWAVIVDLVCIGFTLWIATGIYMWWLLPATRRWGSLALGGGLLSFAWFLATL